MPEMREFPTADVLSVTTGKLLSDRRMDGLCELVEWLTHEKPFPRLLSKTDRRRLLTAAARARDLLIWQHPWLIDTLPPFGIGNSELLDWLLQTEARRGQTLTIVREPLISGVVAGLAATLDSAKQALIELAAALAEDPPQPEGDADA